MAQLVSRSMILQAWIRCQLIVLSSKDEVCMPNCPANPLRTQMRIMWIIDLIFPKDVLINSYTSFLHFSHWCVPHQTFFPTFKSTCNFLMFLGLDFSVLKFKLACRFIFLSLTITHCYSTGLCPWANYVYPQHSCLLSTVSTHTATIAGMQISPKPVWFPSLTQVSDF